MASANFVGKHRRFVVDAVAIHIDKPHDSMRRFLFLNFRFRDGSSGLCHIQPAPLVEIGDDRQIDQRRTRSPLDREAGGDGEVVAIERDRVDRRWRLCPDGDWDQYNQQNEARHGILSIIKQIRLHTPPPFGLIQTGEVIYCSV